MCHGREDNRKTHRLHKRCLRTIYNEKQSSFNELLENDGSVSIHERNLKVLLTEIHKISDGLSTPLMKDIFNKQKSKYSITKLSFLWTSNKHSVSWG